RGNGDENRQRQKGAPSKEGTDPTHKNLLKIRLGWTVKIRSATDGSFARRKAEPERRGVGAERRFRRRSNETTLGDANFAAIFSMIISTSFLSKR
ncbi:MAG: hypothetical protein IJ991_14400, partial [Thermoguttaceae bacterium]|nr:hypothetical protein [Thermoguttaceae bacterium]